MRNSFRAISVVVIVGLAAACTASSASSQTTDATPMPSTATSTPDATPIPTPAACTPDASAAGESAEPSSAPATETPLSPGPLEPGRYTTTQFEPRIALTLGSGWTELFADDSDEVAFERSGPAFLGITRVTCVIAPSNGREADAPSDLAAWLSEHYALQLGSTAEVTVAGLPGTMLEGIVAQTVEMFAYPAGNLRVVAGERIRYYILELDGSELTIVVMGSPSVSDALIAEAESIVDSLEVFP
jgi:hypothetical protein